MDDMQPPRLVRQDALEDVSLEPPPPRSANEMEDERIWIEEQQRNTRNLDNVLSHLRPERNARNIDNVMSDIRSRTGGKTRARKNRRTRARKNRRTRARKNRRTRARR